MKQKSERLAEKIEAMKAELAAAERSESEAADRELLTLIHKAGCRDQVDAFVRKLLDQKRAARKRGNKGGVAV